MNRNKIISIFIICTIAFSFTEMFGKDAAKLRIIKTIQITPDGQYYQDPKLSPDGSMVVFKKQGGGIFLRDADGTGPIITVLPPDKGAFTYVWSPNSKSIAYDVSSFEMGKRRMELHVFDIDNKSSTIIRGKDWPFRLQKWTIEGIKADRKKQKENQKTGLITVKLLFNHKTENFKVQKIPYVYFEQIEKRDYIIVNDGNGNTILKKPDYYLPLLSPTRDKLLAGYNLDGHTYIMDISGTILGDLGMADEEQWSPDGKFIVYEIPEYGGNHGQVMTASEIYVINADGTGKNKLTDTPNIVERKGQWSEDASKITYFDHSTGIIYTSSLEYKD